MSTKIQIFFTILVSVLLSFNNPLFSETTVKVIIPNASKTDENIISIQGSYLFEGKNVNQKGSLFFSLDSHDGNMMVWSAVVPTYLNSDSVELFVEAKINLVSDSLSMNDITLWQVTQNETNTFLRWIFHNLPEVRMTVSEEDFQEVYESVDTLTKETQNSIVNQLDVVLGELLPKYTKLTENENMVCKGVWKYERLCYASDFQNLTEKQLKRKLKTQVIHLLEEINFVETMTDYKFDCTFGVDDGYYFFVNLFLK